MLVALGVSGGIAAYKACEIVRGLDRAGVEVQVILTPGGSRFITPLTLETLSRRKVLLESFELGDEQTIRHIDLARRVACLAVAPATANVLAKLAQGIADDLLTTFAISLTAPVIAAPAMNTRMWLHPATQENLRILRSRSVRIVEPEHGWLAEGEVGQGRMADPGRVVTAILDAARQSQALSGRKIVVTAGPTHEALDPVRYLGNRSSGKMGYAVAASCARRGAQVVLISGPVSLAPPYGTTLVPVRTAAEMQAAVEHHRVGADAVFMTAAVADYVPRVAAAKIKRSGEPLTLVLDEGPDILAELGRRRAERLLVGFAAETESLVENARAKLVRKNLDFIVANDVSRPGVGLDADDNAVTILGRAGQAYDVARASKAEVAEAIVERVFAPPDDAVS